MTTTSPQPADVQNPLGPLAVFDKGSLQTRVAADLSHDHIAGIYVARVEAALRAKIAEITRNYNAAQASHSQALKNYQDIQKTLSREYLSRFKGLIDALSALGFTGLEPEVQSYDFRAEENLFYVTVCLELPPSNTPFGYDRGDIRGAQKITKTWKSPATPELKGAYEACVKAHEEAEHLARELGSVRSALANLPSVERQAKAALVSQVVGSLEGGQDLLANLDASINVDDIVRNLRTM